MWSYRSAFCILSYLSTASRSAALLSMFHLKLIDSAGERFLDEDQQDLPDRHQRSTSRVKPQSVDKLFQ